MTAELVTSYVPRGLPQTGTEPDTEFEEFYGRYHACVLGYAWKLFGPTDAEDIAQETMARAFAHFDRLDPDRDPWPWLCVVARRVGTDIVRSHARTVTVEDNRLADLASVDSETPFEAIQAQDDRSALRRALALLSPNDRRVLRLREYDDLSASDIAALLDCSETAVRQQLFRARRRLAQRFRAVGGTAAVTPVLLLRSARLRISRSLRRVTHAVPAAASGSAMVGAALLSVAGGITVLTAPVGPRTVALDARTTVRTARSSAETARSARSTAVRSADAVASRVRASGSALPQSGNGDLPVDVSVENKSQQPLGRRDDAHQRVEVAVVGRRVFMVDRKVDQSDGQRVSCFVLDTAHATPAGTVVSVTCV